MQVQRYDFPPPVRRSLSPAIADPKVEVLVDSKLLPQLASAAAMPSDPAFDAFAKALKGYALGQAGAQPVTLKAWPGLLAMAAPPEAGTQAEMSLRFALKQAEAALKDEIGPGAFTAISLVVTAPRTIEKLLDDQASPFDRSLAGAKLMRDCTRVLETVWPQLGPWSSHLGLAIQVAETGQLAYLGYRATVQDRSTASV
jgi:hypothetical protein